MRGIGRDPSCSHALREANMSENYKFYVKKVAEVRAARTADGPLRHQLEELLQVVRKCEAIWALEERIERS
jgi:hypothetical protein